MFSTITSASAKPWSTSPLRTFQEEITLLLPWILGAEGFIASRGSNTAGRSSYSATIAQAAMAFFGVSAATSATGSPK